MAWLKFYEKERGEFKTAHDTNIFSPDTEMIFRKLCRHFKITNVKLEIGTMREGYGRATYSGIYSASIVKVARKTDFLILCHEIAHIYNRQKLNCWGHNKRLWKTLKKIIKYCEKKDYWGLVPQTSTFPTEGQNYPD
jgi:predicted metal-dependent hydrolase